jgi:type IV secretion system protein VirB11
MRCTFVEPRHVRHIHATLNRVDSEGGSAAERGSASAPSPASHLPPDSSLTLTLRELRPILDDPTLTELCINRPHEAFIERPDGWQRKNLPFATYDWCLAFAKLVANHTHQRIDQTSPVLSATLPTGERVQLVLPPATTDGTVAITLRRPSAHAWSLNELAARGMFSHTSDTTTATAHDIRQRLNAFLRDADHESFLRLAVQSRQNILLSGATGSGKTTLTKALIREIPSHERLITIEDTRELDLSTHPNHVRLYYSKDGQGRATTTPRQLLEATLRMKPDRVLLAELRSDEAFYYLRNINSGHPGSITSVHAASAELAFEQLVLLVKENQSGRELARADILQLLHRVIDLVVQFQVIAGHRFVREIWYRGQGCAMAVPPQPAPA